MTEPIAHPGVPIERQPAASRRPTGAWGWAGGLLGVEMVVVSTRFDVGRLAAVAGLSGATGPEWLPSSRMIALGGIAGAAATLLFGAGRLARERARADSQGARPSRAPWYLAGQVAAFAGFVAIAALVLESSGGRAVPVAWSAAWVATGAACLGLAVAVALPPSRWWSTARGLSGAIAAGSAVGVTTAASGLATAELWRPLAGGTIRLSAALLGLVHPVVICRLDERVLGTPGFTVHIAPACSGYEGIGLVLAFLAAFLWYDRAGLRFPRAWLLLPIGMAAIWACNAARIAALVTVGAWVSPRLAVDGFHSQAGSIGFTAVALGLVAAGRSRAFRVQGPARVAPEGRINPAAPYLVPQLVLLATTMIAAAFSDRDGFDRAYPLRVVAAGVALWWFRARYRDLARSWSWVAAGSGVLVFAGWMALEPAGARTAGPLAGLSTVAAAAWLAARVIGSVVAVPIAEELAFRGFLARRIGSPDFESSSPRRLTWPAIALSSIAFGALHGRWLAGGLAGLVYALAYRRRGELSDAILAHATTNALIAAYVLTTGHWSLWS